MAKITFINDEHNISKTTYAENKEEEFNLDKDILDLFKHSLIYIISVIGLIIAFYYLQRLF